MVNLEATNKRLQNLQWLSSDPSAEKAWHYLSCLIDNARLPGDKFEMPNSAQPYAWRALWAIWETVSRRASAPPDPVVMVNRQERADTDRLWMRYLAELEQLRSILQYKQNASAYFEFLGLRESDLGSPLDPEMVAHGGKRAGWMQIAGRVSRAVRRWLDMPEATRWMIPMIISVERSERTIAELKEKITAFDARITELEGEKHGLRQ